MDDGAAKFDHKLGANPGTPMWYNGTTLVAASIALFLLLASIKNF